MDDGERMLIEQACARLQVLYTHYVDFGESQRVAELFAPDGVFELSGQVLQGREAIAKRFAPAPPGAPARVMRHVLTNQLVTALDADSAEGLVYLTFYSGDEGDGLPRGFDGPRMIGCYRDRFVRTDAGWRIGHRGVEVALSRGG